MISLCDCLEDITKGKQIPGQQGTNYLWFIGCIQLISFIIWTKKKSLEYVIFPEKVTAAINEMIDCNGTEKKKAAVKDGLLKKIQQKKKDSLLSV